MLREGMNGFCMALADSVPGVSGGTVAFILGFYDRFIGSINDFVFGNMEKKKTSFSYLVKLGIGWMTGMVLAVLLLSSLFESYIYTVSSLFMGFIAGSIPLIIREEKESFGGSRNILKGIGFCIAGILVVAGIAWLNGKTGVASMDLGQFHIGTGIRLFFIGMIAISAMFLPGISGSTLLLIFGAYIPVITAVRGLGNGFFLSATSDLLWTWCSDRSGYGSKRNSVLSGKIPYPVGICHSWNDDRIVLCDHAGTCHTESSTAGDEIW